MKSKLIKRLIGGLSFTTALFVFQACYGTPQDFGADVFIEGIVKSGKTGLPIKGIKVSVKELPQHELTAEDGSFSFYTLADESCVVKFEDIDAQQNGLFINKDTTLVNLSEQIHLNIFLEER
jgi:hypothetical protein